MFNPFYLFMGFLGGMVVCSVFVPPTLLHKVLPDPSNPGIVFKNPKVDNGFFQVKSVEVPCTAETDSLNLMSMLHKW